MRPNSTTKRVNRKKDREDSERVRALVSKVVRDEDDTQAAALVALLWIVANETEGRSLADQAIAQAYTRCRSFSTASDAFLIQALRMAGHSSKLV